MDSTSTDPTKKHSAPSDLDRDPFIVGMLKRIPVDSRGSFTDDQLLALKIALSGRKWGKHAVNLRGAFGIWNWRYYYVIVGGRERRDLSPSEKRTARFANAVLLSLIFTFSFLIGLVILYFFKSALGINLFSGSHFDIIPGTGSDGAWNWFRKTFL